MATTAINSSASSSDALSSAKTAVSGAKRACEEAEAALQALILHTPTTPDTITKPDTQSVTGPPSTKKRLVSSGGTEDKENSASSSRQRHSNGPTSGVEVSNRAAGTCHGAKAPDARTLVSKMNGFAQAIKKAHTRERSAAGTVHKNKASKGPSKAKSGHALLGRVAEEVNTEEEIVFKVNARPFRLHSTGYSHLSWIKSDMGSLKIYRHKTTGKTRLVQRNPIGTVKLNVAIANGMHCLEKVQVPVQTGRKARQTKVVEVLQFFAVAEAERGVEYFLLKVHPHKLGLLYEQLIAAGAEPKL